MSKTNPGNYFEDFRFGQVLTHATPRTVTDGDRALYMALYGPRFAVQSSDAFAQAISYALQYGVPLQVLVDKFSHARFEPSGMTRNPEVRFAKSIVDYVFRWMATKFLSPEARFRAGVNMPDPTLASVEGSADSAVAATVAAAAAVPGAKGSEFASMQNQEDAPPCTTCGSIMVRAGACYKCANCGTTSGCG